MATHDSEGWKKMEIEFYCNKCETFSKIDYYFVVDSLGFDLKCPVCGSVWTFRAATVNNITYHASKDGCASRSK